MPLSKQTLPTEPVTLAGNGKQWYDDNGRSQVDWGISKPKNPILRHSRGPDWIAAIAAMGALGANGWFKFWSVYALTDLIPEMLITPFQLWCAMLSVC